jgi:hypothetical protein
VKPFIQTQLEELRVEFDRCWPWMQAALLSAAYEHDGKLYPTHGKEDIWERIVTGKAFFWPGNFCVFVTEFIVSPTGLKTHNNWLTGGEENKALAEVRMMVKHVEEWGWSHGCHRQTGSGRHGWVRVFDGYREFATRKEKDLLPPGTVPKFDK